MKELRTAYYRIHCNNDKIWCDKRPQKACKVKQVIANWVEHERIGDSVILKMSDFYKMDLKLTMVSCLGENEVTVYDKAGLKGNL